MVPHGVINSGCVHDRVMSAMSDDSILIRTSPAQSFAHGCSLLPKWKLKCISAYFCVSSPSPVTRLVNAQRPQSHMENSRFEFLYSNYSIHAKRGQRQEYLGVCASYKTCAMRLLWRHNTIRA